MVVCQLSRDAIGCEGSKCHLCVSFHLLPVKQSFTVSQIFGCPVTSLSLSVFLDSVCSRLNDAGNC